MSDLEWLIEPEEFTDSNTVLARPSAVPKEPGVYGWYFRDAAALVGAQPHHRFRDHGLLYVGIAPSRAREPGTGPKPQNIHRRLRNYLRGTAYDSTLRLTLACLLRDTLGLRLQYGESGKSPTWGKEGESRLSEWMAGNARLVWRVDPEPWVLERSVFGRVKLPLNLWDNRHPFGEELTRLRREQGRAAREEQRGRGLY